MSELPTHLPEVSLVFDETTLNLDIKSFAFSNTYLVVHVWGQSETLNKEKKYILDNSFQKHPAEKSKCFNQNYSALFVLKKI